MTTEQTTVLVFLLYDEFMQNGGHFHSTEADCAFRQTFGTIEENNTETFTRLLKTANIK